MSVIVSVPVRDPAAVGVKVTLIEQFVPAATDVPQLLAWAKSPLVAMLVMLKAALPLFLNVTACGALVIMKPCEAKVRLEGVRLTPGAGGGPPLPPPPPHAN